MENNQQNMPISNKNICPNLDQDAQNRYRFYSLAYVL